MTTTAAEVRSFTVERVSAWSGLIFLLVFGLGWVVLLRFVPPLAPSLSADEVAQLIASRRTPMLLGAIVVMVSSMVMLPFSAILIQLIRSIEGRVGMLTLMTGLTLATNLISNFFAGLFLATAAFRPDRTPASIQLATDLAFLLFMGGIPLFIGAWAFSAYAVLVVDRRPEPILPRWFGYLNLLTAILYLPELLIYLLKSGPFAWNGIVGFWIPASLFAIYFSATALVFPQAVTRCLPR